MYEVHRILVPTDFSRHADEALEHALVLGKKYAAEITLLHVDEFSVLPLGAKGALQEPLPSFREAEQAFVEQEFERLRARAGRENVRLVTRVQSGRAYKVIVEESEREEYDLIVLATRGHTHLSASLIGSTAERVVRLSRQPVLSIQGMPLHEGAVTSVLCPTDLSPAGNVALSYGLSIARKNGATLYVQFVSEIESVESEVEARKKMPDLAEYHAQAEHVAVEFLFDRDVEPSNSIIRFAEDRDVSLIVMSTHGRKGLRRVYIGNNTAEVVRQATRPVLTVAHPLHRLIFSGPVTEQRTSPLV